VRRSAVQCLTSASVVVVEQHEWQRLPGAKGNRWPRRCWHGWVAQVGAAGRCRGAGRGADLQALDSSLPAQWLRFGNSGKEHAKQAEDEDSTERFY
jgi:hypothetical protein